MKFSSRTIGRLGLVGVLACLGLIPASAGPDELSVLTQQSEGTSSGARREEPNLPTQGEELTGTILKGYVRLRPEGRTFTDGTLHIILENVTRQDVRSRLVAEAIQYHIAYDGRDERLYPFAFGPFGFR